MIENEFDVLLALTILSSKCQPKPQNDSEDENTALLTDSQLKRMGKTGTQDTNSILSGDMSSALENAGRIVEFNLCAYDIKKTSVLSELQTFIRPEGLTAYPEDGIPNLAQEDFSKSITLKDFIAFLNDFCFFNFTKNNLSFCLMTIGDDLLTKQLPAEAMDQHIKLVSHFYTYFDIVLEFNKFYAPSTPITTLEEMMAFLSLKDAPLDSLSQHQCKNTVRIMNKMTKDGHKFHSPKVLNTQFKLVSHSPGTNPQAQKQNDKKEEAAEPRSRSPTDPGKSFYVRLRGLPYTSRELDVISFFGPVKVHPEDLAFMYNLEGKFSGDCYVRIANEEDFKRAKGLDRQMIKSRYIEVYESVDSEWKRASETKGHLKQSMSALNGPQMNNPMITESTGILKMRGLPFNCSIEEIQRFFAGKKIMPNGIKRGFSPTGKPSGEAFVFFETMDDMNDAMSLNLERIGSRFIELFQSNIQEYERYMDISQRGTSMMGSQRYNGTNWRQNGYGHHQYPMGPREGLNENYSAFAPGMGSASLCGGRVVKVSNMPMDSTPHEVCFLLKDFGVQLQDIQVLPASQGGYCNTFVVMFQNHSEAQRAIRHRHMFFHRDRYIELHLC